MKINSLYMELTSQCNFHCLSCYNRSGLHPVQYLSWESLYHFLEQVPSAHVSLAGGEPLLYPDLDALILYIENHPNRTFSFVTNGSIDRILSYYKYLSNLKLQVSLDGSCEKINALTRGSGHFRSVMDFIQRAAAIRPLSCKMVINGLNFEDIEPFYRLIARLGCTPVFSFIANAGNALDHWSSMHLTPSQKIHALQQIERLNSEYHMHAPVPYCTHHCPLQDPESPWNLLITSDGRIQPCQSLYDPSFTIGTLDDFSSLDLQMQQIRKAAANRKAADYDCRHCILRTACSHGCGALAFNYHHDFMACDEQCAFRRQQFIHNLKQKFQ